MVEAWQLLKGAEFAGNVNSSATSPLMPQSFFMFKLSEIEVIVLGYTLATFLHNVPANILDNLKSTIISNEQASSIK